DGRREASLGGHPRRAGARARRARERDRRPRLQRGRGAGPSLRGGLDVAPLDRVLRRARARRVPCQDLVRRVVNDLTQRLAAPPPEQRALFEARLKRQGLSAPKPRAIPPIPGRETLAWFPTSLDQERLWFIDQMEPGNPAYNIHQSSRLFGKMDLALMHRAVNASIARHEILRTTFKGVEGRPVQVVAPRLEIDLPVIDLQHLPEGEREKAALDAAVEAAAVRFDLEKGPLVRVGLVRLGPEDHVLTMVMQHAITDRWS